MTREEAITRVDLLLAAMLGSEDLDVEAAAGVLIALRGSLICRDIDELLDAVADFCKAQIERGMKRAAHEKVIQ